MILGFVIVLSIVGISLALVMYANLLPFIGTLGDVKEYNMAYYGAQSSLERSFLVLRQREAGFDGEGGTTGSLSIGPASDAIIDFGSFAKLGNILYRHISGRGDTIPGTGQGTIEPYLLSGSNDYNILSYNQSHTIPLRYDSLVSSDAYRSDITSIHSLSGAGIGLRVYLDLNEKLKNTFLSQGGVGAENLDTSTDYDGDGTSDDIAVDRGWRGSYLDTNTLQSGSFSILPRSVVSYNSGSIGTVRFNDDETLRESVINNPAANGSSLMISDSLNQGGFNPLSTVYSPSAFSHRIITDESSLSGISFIDMLAGGTNDLLIEKQSLTLSLFSPLLTSIGTLYPFIQYKVICEGCDSSSINGPQLAQPYFLIHSESTVGHYTVTMKLQKPIANDGAISQFAVIF